MDQTPMPNGSDLGAKQLVKLREFSTQLAQRLKDAPGRPTEPTRLAVRIGAENFLVEMGVAGEIVPLPEVAPVPWTKPWYRGLANVRGRLVGVVDLLQLTGRAPLPAEQGQQLLVFGEGLSVNAGVLITRAFGIRNLKDLTALPPAGESAPGWEQGRYRGADGVAFTELDLRELARSPAFAAIGV
jgi:twitching motility protein PilI